MYAVAKTRRAIRGLGKSTRHRRLAPRGREPRRQIAYVYLDVFESTGLALYAITLGLGDKARRTSVRIPVVICKVMEARVGHPTTEKVSVDIPHPLARNREVEYPPRREARAGGDDARVALPCWNTHCALVRMRSKISDDAGGAGISQKRVYGTDGLDPLEVAVAS